ncbi:hypothetical protein H2248_002479 [Termitomyces sp. 'cryptogamus']|nr:hypothetical protein H2248_002479 [Termitomyces sp. 'cryptogamus']
MNAALVTKGSRLENNAKNTVLAAAFLLEDDTTDQMSGVTADAVAAKVLDRVGGVVDHLSSSSEFTAATSTSQAETTLALKGISSQLENIASSFSDVVEQLSAVPIPNTTASKPTWANVAAAGSHSGTTGRCPIQPGIPIRHTRMQQRLLRNARTVLVEVDTM